MKRNGLHISLTLCVTVVAGCAGGSSARRSVLPTFIPNRDALPRAVVYGDLARFLPDWRRTTALAEFLYGPGDDGARLLRNPQGLVWHGDRLLVCDQGFPGIIEIDIATGKRGMWNDRDHPPQCPVDIAIDDQGRAFVADSTRRAVLVYDASGRFIEELAPSQDPQRTFRPVAVEIGGTTLYIGNVGDRRVERYDLSVRRWLGALTPPANQPAMIAPTGLALSPDAGMLHIVDSIQGVVFRIGADGHWAEPIGRRGRGPGELVRPKHVCCTKSGLVLVTDSGRQSVVVFDGSGAYLMEIHERAGGWTGLTLPSDMAVVPADLLRRSRQAESLLADGDAATSQEFVVVTDALGSVSLTLLGIVTQERRRDAD